MGCPAQYLTASDETTIDDHISNMTRPFVWGTQIELFAITSFFQIPLYYCKAVTCVDSSSVNKVNCGLQFGEQSEFTLFTELESTHVTAFPINREEY